MNIDEVQNAVEGALDRDPREAPYGFYSGGSFVLDSVRVFMWFETLGEMCDFILNVQPLSYELEGEDLDAYKKEVGPLLDRLKKEGVSETLRAQLGDATSEAFVIDWMGRFEELVECKTEFSRDMVERFLDEVRPVARDELDEFVDFLASHSG